MHLIRRLHQLRRKWKGDTRKEEDQSQSEIEQNADLAPERQDELARFYYEKYIMNGDLEDLGAALKHRRLAVAATPEGHPDMASRHASLAIPYTDWYRRTGDLEVLEVALKYKLSAVAATPEGHPDMAHKHESLAVSYSDKYIMNGNLEDLEVALKYMLSAVAATPEGNPDMASRHQNLARSYNHKYRRTGDLDDLETALRYRLLAIAATPEDHPDMATRHQGLAQSYTDRYKRTGDLDNLEAALRYNLSAVAATPEGHPDMAFGYQCLAMCYTNRYRRMGDLDDLEAALRYNLSAVAANPKGRPDMASRHQGLAESYTDKYRRTGDLDDLESALKHDLTAVAQTPEGHPEIATRQQNLAVSYSDRYTRIGNIEDLEAALRYMTLALAATPEGHPDIAARNENLAVACNTRYRRIGDPDDLEAALRHGLTAIVATPDGHPDMAARYESLATSYTYKYRRVGDLEDLEAALRYMLSAVAATPEGHPNMAKRYQSLAVPYTDRYRRTGDLEDLEAALRYKLSAVAATPEDHPDMAARHESLAASYSDKYERVGNIEDLEAALQYKLSAMTATPEGHPDMAHIHHGLSLSYKDRYRRTGDLDDLEVALKYDLAAVSETPEGHPDMATRHQNLAVSYGARYMRIGDMEDLEASLKYTLSAVAATPEGHPDLVSKHENLAVTYSIRYRKIGDLENLYKAIIAFKSGLKSINASPADIWSLATSFAKQGVLFPSQDILEAYSIALNTLPSLLWLGSSLSNRHDTLIRHDVQNFISQAVGFALQTSHLSLAIEFMEQGLSTTHKQSLQLRDEHDILQTYLPALSNKLHHVSLQLQSSSYKSDTAVNYHALAHERSKLIAQIRGYAGFEKFLLPPDYSYLCSAAEHGPVIMLNCDNTQTNAILILSPTKPPLSLSLSNASVAIIEEHTSALRNALKQFSIHSREIRTGRPVVFADTSFLLQSVISWLWTAVVNPVFDTLKKNGIGHGRLWWCPSGPLTYLPLHAAAPLESSFIQSYTPTLDTLIRANMKHRASKETDILTAIGVVEASGSLGRWATLPFVEKELNNITMIFGNKVPQLRDSQATIKNVVQKMQLSSWLHIACHGHQDLSNPVKSGLVLYDGKLELEKILSIDLPNAKFVYLSACETAMGDSKLMNEAMHLAGGFLAAGFQGAIGTLWSMPDAYGPKVAEVVYKAILGEDNILDVRRAAEGLHLAIQKLRREGAPLQQWMPFIHFGI